MFLVGVFALLMAIAYCAIKYFESCILEDHPRKTPPVEEYVFSKIVTPPREEIEIKDDPYIPEAEETGPTADEQATEWIKTHADLLTQITKPAYEVKQILIKQEYMKDLSTEIKDKIILKLLEIYPMEISRLAIDKDGSIIGSTNA